MDKRKQIETVAENDDDRVLFARIYDRLTGAEQKNIPASTCFLAPREQVLIKRMLPHMELRFFGGASLDGKLGEQRQLQGGFAGIFAKAGQAVACLFL